MSDQPTLSRRGLLRPTSVAAALSGAMPPTAASPAMRPALPPLEVIALNRMAFGPRLGDLEAFRALGSTDEERLAAYVAQQTNPAAIDDSDCDARIAAQNFTTLNKSLEQLWADHVVPNPDYITRITPVRETTKATYLRAVYSRRQLNEVMADFWHNHFNIYGWEHWTAPIFVHYDRDVIRGNMWGNFRQMLEDVAQSTAMLYYLDNRTNRDDGPNENFARELFELHTLGAENYFGVMSQDSVPTDGTGRPLGYVDEDVYEATRCFTGWTVNNSDSTGNTGTFLYRNDWHDRFQKWVLGARIPSDQGPLVDGQVVLDRLAAHPGTGRYLARKLCRRLIADEPPARIVNEAAALFTATVDAPDQLTQVVRLILLSPEFRNTWGEKIKRPLENFMSALRATDAEFVPSNEIWWYGASGQVPFRWRAPNGYPDRREDWSSTMPMLQKWRVINFVMGGADGTTLGIVAASPASASANALADLWIANVLGRPMSESHRTEIVNFIANGRSPDLPIDLTNSDNAERLVHTVGLILLSPDFQWR